MKASSFHAAALSLTVVLTTGAAAQATALQPTFGSAMVGRPTLTQSVGFLIHFPVRHREDLERTVELQGTPGTQIYHHWLTPAQFRASYGATAAQVSAAVRILRAQGFTVDRTSAQLIDVHGPVATVERTFGVRLAAFRSLGVRPTIGSQTQLHVPAALQRLGATVEGLVYHGTPQPALRYRAASAAPLNRSGLFGRLWFDDMKQAYNFPARQIADGSGTSIAVVNEADFSDNDLQQYLHHERIGNAKTDLIPLPSVTHVRVPGAPGFNGSNAAAEADLDTQQVAGDAPGATISGWTTNAYDFPADFLQVYDAINESDSEDIVSTSYGICENIYTPAYNGGADFTGILKALHETFLQGNSEGITYTVSSGDAAGRACPEVNYFYGPSGGVYTTVPSVEIPASDPNVVAVGGGNLITSYDPDNSHDLNSYYVSENGYADPEPVTDLIGNGSTVRNQFWGAGGGQSAVFAKPAWQRGITPGTTRSVPDIGLFVGGCFAGDPRFIQPCADDVSHANTVFGGVTYETIGTSVAAPQAAALFATIEDKEGSRQSPGAGRLGNVNPLIYHSPASYFHKAIAGNNGVVSFGPGQAWNPVYGLGSLFNVSPFSASAGTPQTSTNP